MNIAAIQLMVGQNVQTPSKGMQVGQVSGGTFGSVFSSIANSGATANTAEQGLPVHMVPDESALEIFNATTVEELKAALKHMKDLISDLSGVTNLGNFEELAAQLDLDPKQLIESLQSLLENAGLDETEMSALVATNDFWQFLNTIDKVAPQFFNQLSDSLEGKGDISKQQAIELLTLLKTAELIAPKTDLLLKQEQQVFSLQSYLAMAGERFESNSNASSSAKPGMAQLMEAKHAVRFVVQTDAGPSMNNDGNTEKSLETSQNVTSSAVGTVTVAKGELTITELENRNNARNEALVREMQTIFKRSNLGQTGGTNRLLIKLYPEHLGQVRIELLQTNGIMTARILASTALGKEMLDSQLHQLRNAFVQQNLQVERIDISQSLQDTTRNDRDQAFNQQFRREEQETEDQHEQNADEEMTFQEYLIELEV